MNRSSAFVICATVQMAALAAIRWIPLAPVVAYTAAFIGASILFIECARRLFHTEITPRTLLLLCVLAVLVRLSFLDLDPIGSDDVYRYVWDGKVQASGINPYLYAPNAGELKDLRSERLPALVNHPDMKTVYFPLTQWLFALCYHLSGEALWAYRLLAVLAEIATIATLVLLCLRLGIPAKFVLLYALCPLPILTFGLDAHLDAFGLAFLVLALLFHHGGQRSLGLVCAGLSICVKPVGVLLLLYFFLQEKTLASRLRIVLMPAAIVALTFVPYLGTPHFLEALGTFTAHWTFNGALFETLNAFIADNQKTRIICGTVFAVALLALYRFRHPGLGTLHDSFLLLLLCSPVVHPWYVTWLAVLLPVARRWSGIVYAATVSLTSFTVLAYTLRGTWTEYPAAMVVEYLPVLVLLAREMFRKETAR